MAGYLLEWDPIKADTNQRKHGVSFDEAITVFSDPLSVLIPDPDHSVGEERYLVLGMSNKSRILVGAAAERPPRTHIISARLATHKEKRDYEQEN